MHRHNNGLKTAALFGVLWAVLLGLGAIIAAGTRSTTPIWIMALIGVATTAYGYWNSDKIAIRSMAAYPRHRGTGTAAVPDCSRAVRACQQTHAADLPLAHHDAQRLRHRTQSQKRCRVLHRGDTPPARRPRTQGEYWGHELMHVYNRDILTSSVAAAVAGVITSVGQMLLIFGSGGPAQRQPAGYYRDGSARAFRGVTDSDGYLPYA